MAKQSIGMSKR